MSRLLHDLSCEGYELLRCIRRVAIVAMNGCLSLVAVAGTVAQSSALVGPSLH